jgi:glutamate---cysteine ligase / carboxylate-amine ligase
MEAKFTGPSFTLGVEEELMILDGESCDLANEIEAVLDAYDGGGDVKPELLQSVLEIATPVCKDIAEAGQSLRSLRRDVGDAAGRHDLSIGSAGTHPFSLWENQRVSSEPRYRGLINSLRFVARQEIIFGLHVHVGMDDAEKAIHVANGMRVHIPILQALSANSPYWRADDTGLASARMPIFRAFPRVGVPPAYKDWDDYVARIEFMVDTGVMEDYTYVWYDVRPHPELGTVEVRAMDAQTHVEHTLAITALIQAMAHELAAHYEAGEKLGEYPLEMLDENKWLAARHGLDGEIVDLPDRKMVRTADLTRRLYDRLREHAEQLGAGNELEGILDLLEGGTGASRQRLVYEANRDFRELMREIVAATRPES